MIAACKAVYIGSIPFPASKMMQAIQIFEALLGAPFLMTARA